MEQFLYTRVEFRVHRVALEEKSESVSLAGGGIWPHQKVTMGSNAEGSEAVFLVVCDPPMNEL